MVNRTNLKPIKIKSTLPDSVLHVVDSLTDLSPDVSRDRRALAVVCRDGFEINAAMERLAQWRKLFGGAN